MKNNKNILTIAIIAILVVAVLILLVMVINSNKAIKLTMDNYKDYFSWYPAYSGKEITINVKGVSSNFNYEDVEITYLISSKEEKFNSKQVKVNCKINGDGTGYTDILNIETNKCNYEVVEVKGKLKPVGK